MLKEKNRAPIALPAPHWIDTRWSRIGAALGAAQVSTTLGSSVTEARFQHHKWEQSQWAAGTASVAGHGGSGRESGAAVPGQDNNAILRRPPAQETPRRVVRALASVPGSMIMPRSALGWSSDVQRRVSRGAFCTAERQFSLAGRAGEAHRPAHDRARRRSRTSRPVRLSAGVSLSACRERVLRGSGNAQAPFSAASAPTGICGEEWFAGEAEWLYCPGASPESVPQRPFPGR